jgi:hypothetical protein
LFSPNINKEDMAFFKGHVMYLEVHQLSFITNYISNLMFYYFLTRVNMKKINHSFWWACKVESSLERNEIRDLQIPLGNNKAFIVKQGMILNKTMKK